MDIRLRAATEADIPAIRELISLSFRALSEGYYTLAQIESAITHVFAIDTQLIQDGTYFVLEANGQVVGAGGWSKRKMLYGGDSLKREANPLLDPAQDVAHLHVVCVHPDWTGRRAGSLITGVCQAAAREEGFTRMELVSTLAGEPLFAEIGFKVTERTNLPLPDGESLPMVKMDKMLGLEEDVGLM